MVPEMGGHGEQDGIACGMAIAVVDGLEVVDVQDDRGKHSSVASGARDLLCQALQQGAAVV